MRGNMEERLEIWREHQEEGGIRLGRIKTEHLVPVGNTAEDKKYNTEYAEPLQATSFIYLGGDKNIYK